MLKKYGLIGFPLSHSFSKKYFTEKFAKEGLADHQYDLYPLEEIKRLPFLLKENPLIRGLNVTIPHKETVMPLLDNLADSALKVGAVNVIKIDNKGETTGYNSDYEGFKKSLIPYLEIVKTQKALILGTGGAAKAVQAALQDFEIPFLVVSRQKSNTYISYGDLTDEIIQEHLLIINTSPLGMYPAIENCPALPYDLLGSKHFLYDLVYNPEETLFLKKGKEQGTILKNGLEMLYLQAEKAWEIWNEAS